MREFSNEQVMLTLSLLSYRGFWKSGSNSKEKLASNIEGGLEEVAVLNNEWQLVWGPASYRYLGAVFDSSMMYIVQNKRMPHRFAIAVRGTNPIAFSDFLLGDFLSHRLVPWHYGDAQLAPGAQVSLSTALGLKILLSMRSECDVRELSDTRKFDFLFDRFSSIKYRPKGPGNSAIFSCDPPEESEIEEKSRRGFGKLIIKLSEYHEVWKTAAQSAENLTYTLGNFMPVDEAIRILPLRRQLIKLLDASLDAYPGTPVGVLMPNEEKLREKQGDGTGLLEFLGHLAEKYGSKLELFVTGHSKGAALAPALALFLSDTQNDLVPVPEHYRWNPDNQAKIHCYAFAGPTPGNHDFSNYFNSQLGHNFYRYSNNMDWVSLAWISDKFRKTAGIFNDHVIPVPGLEEVVNEVADDVDALHYEHLGRDYRVWKNLNRVTEQHVFEFEGTINEEYNSFVQQWVFQHVEAYMLELGLTEDIVTLSELFGKEPDD